MVHRLNDQRDVDPAPSATPCAQADGGALPRAMFTSVISSPIVTVEPPSQSPTQSGGPVAVDVAPVGTVAVGVGGTEGVGLGVSARLGVGVPVEGRVAVSDDGGVAVADECGVGVAVVLPVGAPVAV
ncbi:MAG TPA: hypothetical protein VL049_19060 [Candidatus Dormibacteraeota bacterium]|nr:hypothetical protein [Candidatus Dormibacteraeota bacterium]